MAASTLIAPGGPSGPRRKKSPLSFGRILAVVALGLVIAIGYNFLGRQTVSERPNEMKTTQVILPPPPPPPPPPETKPVEQPPEPTIAPPIEQPVDTPPPPQANNDPSPGDNALTAREGAGPSNYGLGVGDGGGVRIGGKPGGGGVAGGGMSVGMYNNYLKSALQERVQNDPKLSRLIFTADFNVTVTPDGRVSGVSLQNSRGGNDAAMAQLAAILSEVRGLNPPPSAMYFPQRISVRGRKSAL